MSSPVDTFTDEQLDALNRAHEWDCYTLDAKGRRVGKPDGRPYQVPHPLVTLADEHIKLKARSVVEFGCLEGAQTIGLCRLARHVVAVDVRPDNLVKTAVRTSVYGHFPSLMRLDVETEPPPPAEVYFHSGVLYHLQDPVQHLITLGRRCNAILLDTHYALEPKQSYVSAGGGTHRCDVKREKVEEIRAGVRGTSRWITLDGIKGALGRFFPNVYVLSEREERNGPRCTIVAKGGRGA